MTINAARQSFVKPLVPIIIGPTGVGKTGLSITLAKSLPVEIISLDSVMLYRELNIGSAKPTIKERQGIAHHLIDVTDVLHPWSVGDYINALRPLIATIYQRHHLPLIVGGTMLYYKALTQGLSHLPVTQPAIAQHLAEEYQQIGIVQQYQKLQKIDPVSATRLKMQDTQRIHRALAVYYQTGCALSRWQQLNPPQTLPYRFETVVLNEDIALIRRRIALRFMTMLECGWLTEVAKLYAKYHHLQPRPRPLCSTGYQQLWDYCDGVLTREEMMTRVPIVTGQLAKRQQTWLRSYPNLVQYSLLQKTTLSQLQNWLTRCCQGV